LHLRPLEQGKPLEVVRGRDLARIDALAPEERPVVWHGLDRVPHDRPHASVSELMTALIVKERDASLAQRLPGDPKSCRAPRQQSAPAIVHRASLTNVAFGPGRP
jgi:hypothetical protein